MFRHARVLTVFLDCLTLARPPGACTAQGASEIPESTDPASPPGLSSAARRRVRIADAVCGVRHRGCGHGCPGRFTRACAFGTAADVRGSAAGRSGHEPKTSASSDGRSWATLLCSPSQRERSAVAVGSGVVMACRRFRTRHCRTAWAGHRVGTASSISPPRAGIRPTRPRSRITTQSQSCHGLPFIDGRTK